MTEKQKLDWKQQLKDACITVLEDRIRALQQAMLEVQEAANSEEKSSAGDKYETSRAMAQLTNEMNGQQLNKARQELVMLLAMNVSQLCTQVSNGTVVVCGEQTYFVAIGLGRTLINGQKITLLSPQAPIALLLHQKKAGDIVAFNGKEEQIIEVY